MGGISRRGSHALTIMITCEHKIEKYFKPLPRQEKKFLHLPDPGGELARFMPSNSIQEANKAISKTDGHGSIVKRKGYQKVNLELKTKIAKMH